MSGTATRSTQGTHWAKLVVLLSQGASVLTPQLLLGTLTSSGALEGVRRALSAVKLTSKVSGTNGPPLPRVPLKHCTVQKELYHGVCADIACRSVYGIPVTFIQPLHPGLFFDRERFYGHDDDFER